MVFCVFVPRNPAVDAHNAVINIDKHIAQKPKIKENVNINRSADDACGIDPDIPFHGEKNTQQTEESSYNFQENLKKILEFWNVEEQLNLGLLQHNINTNVM